MICCKICSYNCIFLWQGTRGTVEYLFNVVARLGPLNEQAEFELVQRCLSVLTHQNVMIDNDLPLGATGQSALRRTANLGDMTSSLAMNLTQFAFHLIVELRKKLREEEAKAEAKRASESKEERKTLKSQGSKKKKKKSAKT